MADLHDCSNPNCYSGKVVGPLGTLVGICKTCNGKGYTVEVRTGQIWKENDKRQERYVLVHGVEGEFGDYAFIWTCNRAGCVLSGESKPRKASLERFNGKAGGYSYFGQPCHHGAGGSNTSTATGRPGGKSSTWRGARTTPQPLSTDGEH